MKRICKEILEAVDKCPRYILLIFSISVILMNFFANKSVDFGIPYLALDMGVICSGIASLCLDVLTKLYNHKYADKVMIFTIFVNLLAAIVFFIVGVVPGRWGIETNESLDRILMGNWYVLSGSTIAFYISSCINNFLNEKIGYAIKDTGLKFSKFATRSYLSTFISQLIDNFLFCILVTKNLFSWGIVECVSCSIMTAIIELLFEVFLSPIGFYIVKAEKKNH